MLPTLRLLCGKFAVFACVSVAIITCYGNAFAQAKSKDDAKGSAVPTLSEKWPERVAGPQNFKLRERKAKAKKGESQREFLYETDNYSFVSPIELDDIVKNAVGQLFEGTFAAVKAMPLPIPRVDKKHKRDKLDVVFKKSMADYYASGGPEGSAGVFFGIGGGKDYALIPFTVFGLDPNGKRIPNVKPQSHVISHELAHQLTMGIFRGNTWVNEGFAEYVGYTPYRKKAYDFTEAFNRIKTASTRYNGKWDLPFSLEEFFNFQQNEFYGKTGVMEGRAHQCYTLAAMSIAFFFHLDGEDGVKAFSQYMKELQRSGNAEKANKKLLGKYKSMKNFQDAFVGAWKGQGVEISFKPAK